MSSAPGRLKPVVKRYLRRLSAPLLNRVDGRVWNINWRVEHGWNLIQAEARRNRDELGQATNVLKSSLDIYARSAEESSSYIATELRRIDSALIDQESEARRFREIGLDALYRERLARARHQPLVDLEGELAWLLNYASGHLGFAAQAGLWFNPPVVIEMIAGGARLAGVNERIVELPFAFGALGRLDNGARILDIGSRESTFALSAAALGHTVTAIDLAEIPFDHPNLTSVTGRFEDWTAPEDGFNAAFLISTIEHVGVGGYGEDAYGGGGPGNGADRAMIQRLAELLSDDGFLVLTTPYGPRSQNDFERTYDDAAIGDLLDGWTVQERRYAIRRDDVLWEASDAPAAGERGVVMIVATPPVNR